MQTAAAKPTFWVLVTPEQATRLTDSDNITMLEFWKGPAWLKTRGTEGDDRCALLPKNEYSARLPWQPSYAHPQKTSRSPSGLEERYIRVGIGGAGNKRKSCSPFLTALQALSDWIESAEFGCVMAA
ncbi:hypothetical protein ASPWEDRAFT_173513 [Aspergillus wentii DTO 134E9]|uniref:Uncharacterized protein n=1 Tax=Aspergillus wentii DTO 134E9 TaxID=1073089 RepID=A0A1L9RGM9_ASPWE|nr:uncharacterized protein ASPWEDRAFT_173513 [Aspergillus wentii DTO 134E9]OJJ34080.1 hypothetical protein ASPWEDRAFT_173513 [Aspergillus wentii DTO 134E9]